MNKTPFSPKNDQNEHPMFGSTILYYSAMLE